MILALPMPIISATPTHSLKEAMDRQLAGKHTRPGAEHAPGRLRASGSEGGRIFILVPSACNELECISGSRKRSTPHHRSSLVSRFSVGCLRQNMTNAWVFKSTSWIVTGRAHQKVD